MRIDAHQHFWKFDPVRDAWIDESMQAIRRDFLPEHLEPLLQWHRMDGCVAVQADQSEKETSFLLDLASRNSFIKKVVGWIDLAADDIANKLALWSEHQRLAGFRHILQSEPPEKMREANFRRGIGQLEAHGFTYDILIFPHHLEAALELVDAFPRQPFVIDHLAKPKIRGSIMEPWKRQIRELATRPHVCCKLSGMVTEADPQRWKPDDLRPYVEVVLEAFGTSRVMYGSDWPVCLLAADYGRVLHSVESLIAYLSHDEQADILGGTACRFYGITN
ncbi:MAG: amidohydrolase family protein [Cyclobacteriaceae bacterium]|nr:amidohydrolase family protein [Cyclobacteriaceae bacterium]